MDPELRDEIIAMWNDGMNSDAIAEEIFFDVDIVRDVIDEWLKENN